MWIDGRKISRDAVIETDICIIGAGAAGITIALELAHLPIQVCLIESGAFEYDSRIHELSHGVSDGQKYDLNSKFTRVRQFGGGTTRWASRSRPLDEHDFKQNSWIPHSGWPIQKSTLDPYYERAQKVCKLGPYTYQADYWSDQDYPLIPLTDNRVDHSMFQFGKNDTNFGKEYRKTILDAPNITTIMQSNVTHLEDHPDGKKIEYAHIACLNQNRFRIKADHYILATGGLENPRILLNSNENQPNGLGNQYDLVGRYFMEHPHIMSKRGLILSIPDFYPIRYRTNRVNDYRIQGIFSISPEVLKQEQLGNYLMAIIPTTPEEDHSIANIQYAISPMDHLVRTGNLANTKSDATYTHFHFWEEIEQIPNPNSRVELVPKKDALGMPQLKLHWELTGFDLESRRRCRQIMAEAFALSGVGRINLEEPEEILWGSHHMGTTRMHEDPKQGVVDANCQMHGIHNLSVAGSSVFPTGGCSNPTLTLVALAIRLADHVKQTHLL